ncbi:MAG: DUF167 family protein [Pseudomonadota bacterium]
MLFVEELPVKTFEDRVLLNIKVTPKASSNKIGNIFNNSLKIYVTATANAGQANKAVIELLSSSLKISKSNFSIIKGLTDQSKTICITGKGSEIIKYLQVVINK